MITFKVLDEAENSLRDRNWKSKNKTNRIVSNRIEWNSLKASTSKITWLSLSKNILGVRY